jgi:hypothetical protein
MKPVERAQIRFWPSRLATRLQVNPSSNALDGAASAMAIDCMLIDGMLIDGSKHNALRIQHLAR